MFHIITKCNFNNQRHNHHLRKENTWQRNPRPKLEAITTTKKTSLTKKIPWEINGERKKRGAWEKNRSKHRQSPELAATWALFKTFYPPSKQIAYKKADGSCNSITLSTNPTPYQHRQSKPSLKSAKTQKERQILTWIFNRHPWERITRSCPLRSRSA